MASYTEKDKERIITDIFTLKEDQEYQMNGKVLKYILLQLDDKAKIPFADIKVIKNGIR